MALRPVGGPEEYASANILENDFSALGGNAELTLRYADSGIDNQSFDDSVLTFLNADGGTANAVRLDMSYDDLSSVSGAGSARSGSPVNAITTWEQVRTQETDVLQFVGTGMASLAMISGGPNGYDGLYNVDFRMIIDYGNRQFGGGGVSYSSILLSHTQNANTISGNINATDFTLLTGPAIAALNTSNPALGGVVVFNTGPGTPVDHLTASITYNDPQTTNVQGSGYAVTDGGTLAAF